MPKRKDNSGQPELPMNGRGMKPPKPGEAASPGGQAPEDNPTPNGNGETHVEAEAVPEEVVHRPFSPGKIARRHSLGHPSTRRFENPAGT